MVDLECSLVEKDLALAQLTHAHGTAVLSQAAELARRPGAVAQAGGADPVLAQLQQEVLSLQANMAERWGVGELRQELAAPQARTPCSAVHGASASSQPPRGTDSMTTMWDDHLFQDPHRLEQAIKVAWANVDMRAGGQNISYAAPFAHPATAPLPPREVDPRGIRPAQQPAAAPLPVAASPCMVPHPHAPPYALLAASRVAPPPRVAAPGYAAPLARGVPQLGATGLRRGGQLGATGDGRTARRDAWPRGR